MSKPESAAMLAKARSVAVNAIAAVVNDASLTDEAKLALVQVFIGALDNLDSE